MCRGILSLVTMALALGGVDASKSFKEIAGGLTQGSSHTTRTTGSSGSKHISASISCSSSAEAKSYSKWKSSYIEAGASTPSAAICNLCSCDLFSVDFVECDGQV